MRATRLVHSIRDLSYEKRLEILDLTTLETRRLRDDLIEVRYLRFLKDVII